MNRVLATAKRILARLGPNVLAPLIAGAVAIAVSSVALLLSGNSPIEAFSAMWKVLDSTESVVGIINKAVPYYVAGVAVAIGFKMGLFNIGADGQYRLGALFAAYFGAKADLPAVLHVLYIVLVAVVVAAAWAAIAGILKVTRGVNEVISTIMLNYIAIGLTAWLLNDVLPEPQRRPRRRDQADPRERHASRRSTRSSRRRLPPRPAASCSRASVVSRSSSASATTCCCTAAGSGSSCG